MSKKIENIIAFVEFLLVITLLVFIIIDICQKKEPETISVTDTITDWQHDTVYQYDTKIVKLPIHDTTILTDSLWITDSVLVEVPIYKYYFDTTLTDTNRTIHLKAALSGYDVVIDTLAITTTVEPIIIKETIPWQKRFRPSVGVGIGTNLKGEATVGMYVGVGYLF